MKWPWVSREQVSRERVEAAGRALELAHAELVQERARNAELVGRLLSLKLGGAVQPPQMLTYTSTLDAAPQPPDELRALIHDLAGSDYRKRGLMLRQLAADRAARVPDEDIRAAIITGLSSDGVPL